MEIKLANPRGFCAGVDRAIEIVERALQAFDGPIYVRHEVVHNKFVIDDLVSKGVRFVDELEEVPDDSIVIFSAHGVSQAVKKEAEGRNLKVFDATCPLVTKVHFEVTRYSRLGQECILIGHAGHQEVEGTMGQYDNSSGGAMYLLLDVRATKMSGLAFAETLLEKEGIAVMPGESFGQAAAGHLRLALTVDDAALAEAVERLLAFAARHAE